LHEFLPNVHELEIEKATVPAAEWNLAHKSL
jgi:hypothetical protein